MAAYNQSRIKLFRRCQRAYAFRYDSVPGKELVPRLSKEGLQRGTWLHAFLEAHHRDWAGVQDDDHPGIGQVSANMVKFFSNLFDEEREEYGHIADSVHRVFRSYLYHWKNEGIADKYRIATLNDGRPAIEFTFEIPLTKWKIKEPFKGRIDALVEDLEYGGLWIWDAKWVSKIPGPDDRMMSPQALLYVWALRLLGYDVRGFVFLYGRTTEPTVPNVLMRNSKYGAAGFLTTKPSLDCDYLTYLDTIKSVHGEDWKYYAKSVYYEKLIQLRARQSLWFRMERIPTEKDRIRRAVLEYLATIRDIQNRNKKIPVRSYEYNCRWNCDYYDLCVAEFTGLDIEGLTKAKYQVEAERYDKSEAVTF